MLVSIRFHGSHFTIKDPAAISQEPLLHLIAGVSHLIYCLSLRYTSLIHLHTGACVDIT